MLISDLQKTLRKTAKARIKARITSGAEIARKTAFEQAHISNFLNGRRGLSVEGFDKVLGALNLSVLDLVECEKDRRRRKAARKRKGLP